MLRSCTRGSKLEQSEESKITGETPEKTLEPPDRDEDLSFLYNFFLLKSRRRR